MRTILLILLTFSITAVFAQKHYTIPVEELDTLASKDSSSFNHHPIQLDVEVNYSVNSWDTLTIEARTTYYENISNSPFYKAKNTYTVSVLNLPASINLARTVNADNTYNLTYLNPILQLFGFKYRMKPVVPVNPYLD